MSKAKVPKKKQINFFSAEISLNDILKRCKEENINPETVIVEARSVTEGCCELCQYTTTELIISYYE